MGKRDSKATGVKRAVIDVKDALLHLDEADALLGKRSEVKDAHDRYANIDAEPPKTR